MCFWRCRLSFQVTSYNPVSVQRSQTDPTFRSNALKCICIVTGCQVLSFPPLCLFRFFSFSFSHTFVPCCIFSESLWLSLPFLCLPICLPTRFFFFFSVPLFTLFFYLFFCLWAENWPKWMRSWRAVNTVIIWLLPALLTAEDALSMATLCFVISGENWDINLLEIRTGW